MKDIDKFCEDLNVLEVFNKAYPGDVARYEFFKDKLAEYFFEENQDCDCVPIEDIPGLIDGVIGISDSQRGLSNRSSATSKVKNMKDINKTLAPLM